MRKKLGAILLAAISAFSMASCAEIMGSNIDEENEYNVPGENKTKIVVQNIDGGIGTIWLDEAAERFAKLKKDESYANGKTGVYVEIERTTGIDLNNTLTSSTHMYFDERKWDISSLAQRGNLLSVTDIVTDETREGGSIESTIYSEKLGSLKGNDGEYYSLPHYEFFGGVSYDVDVFETNNAYFSDETETAVNTYNSKFGTAKFVANASAKKSKGPDGTAGTEDDGLPCSMEEYIILMSYFKERTDYAPIVLSGKYPIYSNYFMEGWWAALAGYEQMTNYYNCTGEVDVVTGYTNENLFAGIDYIKKPIVEKVEMTEELKNGYYGSMMAAKYYAIAMLEIIEEEGFFSADSFVDTITHLDAQRALIYNPIDTKYTKTAMLMEASYWYNEAAVSGSFDLYKDLAADTAERNIRWMPLPSAFYTVDATQTTNTLLDIGMGVAVINASIKGNAELEQACKDFMAFLYTEEELKAFTSCTGMSRPLDYGVTTSELDSVSGFYSDLWELSHETGKVVYYSGSTQTHNKAKASLKHCLELPMKITMGAKHYTNYISAIRTGGAAVDLFESTAYDANAWLTILGE